MEPVTDTLKKIKRIIIVLSILLGLSLAALAGVILYRRLAPSGGSAVIPDNYIEPATSSKLDTGPKETPLPADPVLLCASVPTAKLSGNAPITADRKSVV